ADLRRRYSRTCSYGCSFRRSDPPDTGGRAAGAHTRRWRASSAVNFTDEGSLNRRVEPPEAAEKLHLALELPASLGRVAFTQEIWRELAGVAFLRGRAELGARLAGATERLQKATGSALWDPADFELAVDSLRGRLGPEAFEAAQTAGHE